MVDLKLLRQFVCTVAAGHCERSEIIRSAGFLRRYIIGKRMVILFSRLFHLLAQRVKSRQHYGARLVSVQLNIIANAVSRPEPVNSFGDNQLTVHYVLQQFLCVLKKLPCLLSHFWIIKNLREPASHFPGVKKWRPIDIWDQFIERLIRDCSAANEIGHIDPSGWPINRSPAFPRLFYRDQFLIRTSFRVVFAQTLLIADIFPDKARFKFLTNQRTDHSGCARGIEDMNRRPAVVRRYLHGSMSPARWCPHDE